MRLKRQSEQPGVVIQRAANADIPAIVDLMNDFYAESDSALVLEHRWAAASFATLLSNPALGCVWLASSNQSFLGYAVLTVRYAMEHGALSGYIDDLYVRPEHRRQGVANALLGALFADCRERGCKSVHVEAGGTNEAALALYSNFGLKTPTDGRLHLGGALPAAGI